MCAAVKKFPRKAGREGKSGAGDCESSDTSGEQARFQKVLKNFSKGKRKARSAVPGGGGGRDEGSTNGTLLSPRLKQVKAESESEVDSDLSQHLMASPSRAAVVTVCGDQQSTVYSLPRGGEVANGESGVPHPTPTPCSDSGVPRDLLTKKIRLENTLSQLRSLSPPPPAVFPVSLSPPPLPQSAPYTPPSFQHPSHYPLHPYNSHPGSVVNSPESHPPSVYNSHTNTPYATPHETPAHSPLPSPTTVAPPHPPPLPQYPSHSSLFSLPTFTRHNNLLFSQSPGAVFLNSSQQVPFRVLPVAQPILPFMASFPSFQPQVHSNDIAHGPSPFSIIPIPSSASQRLSRPSQVLLMYHSTTPE